MKAIAFRARRIGMKTIAFAAAVAALAVVLAGCGSGGSHNASSAAPRAFASGQAPQIDQGALDGLLACLKKHGATPPSRPPSGQLGTGQMPTLDAKMQAALQACSQYAPAPQGGFSG